MRDPKEVYHNSQTVHNILKMDGPDLTGADLHDVDFSEYRLEVEGVRLANASFWNADLSGADLSGADAQSANFNHANIDNANFDLSFLWECDFRDTDGVASFRDACLSYADTNRAETFEG